MRREFRGTRATGGPPEGHGTVHSGSLGPQDMSYCGTLRSITAITALGCVSQALAAGGGVEGRAGRGLGALRWYSMR
jgi:hypothetical protein